MEYTKETINELANKIAMAIAINKNNTTFNNNEIKKIFINRKALAMLCKNYSDCCYYYCHYIEGDDTLFGYPVQAYYDNKDEPEFYLGI